MRFLPLVLGTLLLQVPAKADKFWLSDPEAQKEAAEGSSPHVVIGVLIKEDAEGYHVRIDGGTVILAKAAVFKVEKDNLTVDTIVKAEKDRSQELEAADRERQMAQSAERRARDVQAMEASSRRAQAAPAASQAPAAEESPAFDPVIDALRSGTPVSNAELMRDAQLAFSLTRDRRYIKLVRQLRRMG